MEILIIFGVVFLIILMSLFEGGRAILTGLLALVIILIRFSIPVAIIYAIIHFVMKYW